MEEEKKEFLEKEQERKKKKLNKKIIIYIVIGLIAIYLAYTIYLLIKQPTDIFTVEEGQGVG